MTTSHAVATLNDTASASLPGKLLYWYDRHRRIMPWRALPGCKPDPYKVWISEIMLQQTTVVTVGLYFEKFLGRWPTVGLLADANLDEVLHAWQGLGYYARARNLHKCAVVISSSHNGQFPESETELLKLPGIGPYTAAAIVAIAFDRKATVVDGNVERVISRLYGVQEPLPGAKNRLRELATQLTPETRCGDYAQAVMDLGATICSYRNPTCNICPWVSFCEGHRSGLATVLQNKTPKTTRPVRYGVAFWIVARDGSIFLRRRPDKGLLGGMIEIPSTQWGPNVPSEAEVIAAAPVNAEWRPIEGSVYHTFTHFDLRLRVIVGHVAVKRDLGGIWCVPNLFGDLALPT
ncbi:MAG: A/G-specific adenine glycosylase [Pseudomonadota bacterium]|nr:A/G-specific adenine glycosylase [Pseudomonadota bacterium]